MTILCRNLIRLTRVKLLGVRQDERRRAGTLQEKGPAGCLNTEGDVGWNIQRERIWTVVWVPNDPVASKFGVDRHRRQPFCLPANGR